MPRFAAATMIIAGIAATNSKNDNDQNNSVRRRDGAGATAYAD